ncbi:MAG: radical SAM protein [Candidatus Margulisbacteria bacterium]|nr:radical SAM protein [Candidatus Margulisiibacteriota bacterium]
MNKLGRTIKYIFNAGKTLLGKILGGLVQPQIEYLFWEVTDLCNSRCIQCNIWQNKPSGDILTLAEVENIFSSGFFRHVKEVIISGGEPILLPDLEAKLLVMQKYIRPNALVSFSTNGLLPDKVLKVVEACLRNKMNLAVGVSLDGIGEHHDRIRGVKGNFEKVEYLLGKLFELRRAYKGLKVLVGYTLSSNTVDYMPEVKKYVEGLGMDFAPQMYEEFTFYKLTDKVKNSYDEFSIDMVKKRDKMRQQVETLGPCFQKEILLRFLQDKPLRYNCASMRKFFVLRANGDVSPCLRFAHIRLGNIRSGNLKEWWRSQEVRKGRAIVDKCPGCSNTWGTLWSMEHWFPPFINVAATVMLTKAAAGAKALFRRT